MCKKILNILFPTNVLGQNVRSIPYKLPDGGTITLNIVFDGDRLQINYTNIEIRMGRKTVIHPESTTFTDGDTYPVTIYRQGHGAAYWFVGSADEDAPEYNMIYLKCTNVRSLEINGETII